MDEKERYNKLRIFLSIFGISYSYYIRKCNGILFYNENANNHEMTNYYKSWEAMQNTREGYLYWRIIKYFWIHVLSGEKTL